MSVSGLCQICESRPAQERCENCGTLACEQHYEREKGLCADCAARAESEPEPGPNPDPDPDSDDVDIHRF